MLLMIGRCPLRWQGMGPEAAWGEMRVGGFAVIGLERGMGRTLIAAWSSDPRCACCNHPGHLVHHRGVSRFPAQCWAPDRVRGGLRLPAARGPHPGAPLTRHPLTPVATA